MAARVIGRSADDPEPMSVAPRKADVIREQADVQGVGSVGFQTDTIGH